MDASFKEVCLMDKQKFAHIRSPANVWRFFAYRAVLHKGAGGDGAQGMRI